MKSVKLIPNIRFAYTPILVAIIVALAFLLLCSLSCWQLQRGLTKQALLSTSIQQSQLPVIRQSELSAVLKNPSLYNDRKIKLQGTFDHRNTILVDNQVNRQQMGHPVGYHVITPFFISPTHSILVNRGWIPRGASRTMVPPVLVESVGKEKNNTDTNIADIIPITGQIHLPTNNRFIKNNIHTDPFNQPDIAFFNASFPLRVQAIDMAQLQTVLKNSIAPIMIYLSSDSILSFEAIPEKAIWLTPEKHFAYALQWLLLAFSLLIIYYIVCVKQKITSL